MAATDDGYPRFSAGEMARREDALAAEMAVAGVDHVVLYGADRSGAAVQWLTQWPVTREAVVLWSPSGPDPLLLVQFANHVDNARRMAPAFDVRWGGPSSVDRIAEVLRRRGRRARRARRLGVVGPLPAAAEAVLGAVAEPVPMDAAFRRLRLTKSAEELDWVRRGASLTDSAVAALGRRAGAGVSEAQLGAIVEGAYLGEGGTNHIHYFAATPMASPRLRVPAQWPSDRRLDAGDVLTCEVSASWWGYPGQLLRTFTIEAAPSPLYRDLHEVADAAFDAVASLVAPGTTGAELAAAAGVIGEAGFTTCDDVVHGFVGGYLPPVVPGGGRAARHDDFILGPGMTVVVQPNVVTRDGTAGVQTGELLVVSQTGHERLHTFPRGMGRVGRAG